MAEDTSSPSWWNSAGRISVDVVNLVLLLILLVAQIFITVFVRLTRFKIYLGRNTSTIAIAMTMGATILNILLVFNNATVWFGAKKFALIATLDEIFDSVIMVSILMVIARFCTIQLIRNVLKKTDAPKKPIAICSIASLVSLAILQTVVFGIPKIVLNSMSEKGTSTNKSMNKATKALDIVWEAIYIANMIAIIIVAIVYTILYYYKRITDDKIDKNRYYLMRVILLDVLIFFFAVFVVARLIVTILKLKIFNSLMQAYESTWPFSVTRLLTLLILIGMTIVISPILNKTNRCFGLKPKETDENLQKRNRKKQNGTTIELPDAKQVDLVDVEFGTEGTEDEENKPALSQKKHNNNKKRKQPQKPDNSSKYPSSV
jgi:hypothetical protein